ncbi:hypothetical protein T484DRAFT_1639619 [Baffinella frigidus]|nr:hypothetical protein T484DRAFT_1639619 [Cryptophyta sp. CCMP2293]
MDPTRFSLNDVCHLALEIFEAAGLPDELAANVGRVQRFILAVREGMHDNAYHNFYHVFDVTQTVSVMARRTGTLDRLNAWERFALLAAALCHDLEHPGVTSVFLDRAGGSVAGAFKDTVLEKHHVLRAFEVMVGQDIGLLKGLSSESYWDFRNAVAGCILATDFAKHADYCNQVGPLRASRPIPIQLEMELIIKCADISNVLKPFPVARRWALRVTDEFFAQGDVERARGMDVTPSCDREKQSCVDLQVGFIDHMCAPFFDAVATLYPALRPDVARLHQNSAKWAAYSDAELASFRREQDASELEASQQAAELEHDSEQHRSGDQRSSPDSDARPSDARSRLPRRGSDARSRLPRLNHVDEDSVGSPSTSSFSPLCVSPGQLTPGLEVMMRRALERQASSSQESLDAFAPSPYLMWGPG